MKIARFRHRGMDGWGLVDTGSQTISPILGTIAEWGPEVTSGESDVAIPASGDRLALADVRLLAPIEPTATIFGVGMNYWSHLEKLGQTERPASTQGFLKPTAAIIGPDDELEYPSITEQLDFEIELVAVIGRPMGRAFPQPTNGLLGYTVGNDVSARDTPSPMGGFDLFSMKSLNRATPLGPWVATKDELGGAGQIDVEMTLRVNGELRQRDRTKNMIWSLDECLDYVLARSDLRPGDVLFTGTTDGVAFEDGRWLQPGDVMESEIEGIGVIRNVIGPRPSGVSAHD
jgi:2-keto-4-pentenoate hydratase/2-oxohepta-3-ene-1,7-dioic acid hydratase in catechol pathway